MAAYYGKQHPRIRYFSPRTSNSTVKQIPDSRRDGIRSHTSTIQGGSGRRSVTQSSRALKDLKNFGYLCFTSDKGIFKGATDRRPFYQWPGFREYLKYLLFSEKFPKTWQYAFTEACLFRPKHTLFEPK